MYANWVQVTSSWSLIKNLNNSVSHIIFYHNNMASLLTSNIDYMSLWFWIIINHVDFFKMQLSIVTYFRHWSKIPSARRGLSSQLSHMQHQDGTYLASEFDYSLPRHCKGYDTVGYKHYNPQISAREDPRFFTNIRPDRENDKGYYSDRIYESPIVNTDSGTLTFTKSNKPYTPNDRPIGFTS